MNSPRNTPRRKVKRLRKGEWSVQFTLKLRTDMGYSCAYIRRETKRRWPNLNGLSVRRIG